MKRPRKPKDLPDSINNGTYTMARVHEDVYAEQFADPGDIRVRRDVIILEDLQLFDGNISYEMQAKEAEALGKWLLKYAAWIKTRKIEEDPKRRS